MFGCDLKLWSCFKTKCKIWQNTCIKKMINTKMWHGGEIVNMINNKLQKNSIENSFLWKKCYSTKGPQKENSP
jgi:hypothetical protein